MSWGGGTPNWGQAEEDGGWWAEDSSRPNLTYAQRCQNLQHHYHPVTAVICGMYFVFGLVYCLFGYRCFKAVMFLTGFIFASVIVYVICLEEDLLPAYGNAGVALGAGLMFGLITMLVQYVGLFMTGLHTGLFLALSGVALLQHWWMPSSIWVVVGLVLCSGLILAILTLCLQKALTVLGTSVYGGAIITAALDYFIEKFLLLHWFWDRLRLGDSPPPPCWFSWIILAVWPATVIIGSCTQFRLTGRGLHHQQFPTKRAGGVNLQRVRSREARAEMRQKKYRYLYQVRTAHGDVISQEYIQSLQRKASPAAIGGNDTLQSDSTHTTMLAADSTPLAPLTESEEDEAPGPSRSSRSEPGPSHTRVAMHE